MCGICRFGLHRGEDGASGVSLTIEVDPGFEAALATAGPWASDGDAPVPGDPIFFSLSGPVYGLAAPGAGGPATRISLSGDKGTDGLIWSHKWGGGTGEGVTLTYSFPGSDAAWTGGYGSGEPDTGFKPLNWAQKQAVRDALDAWSDVADVTFVEVPDKAGDVGVLRFGNSKAGVSDTSWGYFPDDHFPESGDVWFNGSAGPGANFAPGGYDYATVVHEIGHALGLSHPHDGRKPLPAKDDWLGLSVMSYRAFPNGPINEGYENDLFPHGPMLNDVAAIQHIYGANDDHDKGATTYKWARGERIFETIHDAGGKDTID